MSRKSKGFVIGGLSGLIVSIFTFLVYAGIISKKLIPAVPDRQSLSAPVYEQLEEAYRKAIKRPSSDNIGDLAMSFHSNAFYDKASICYSLAIKKDRKKWIWSYYLGCLNREMGDTRSAIKNFKHVTEIKPDQYLAWYYEGECYRKVGQNDSAEYTFNKIIANLDRNEILKTERRYDYFPFATYTMYNLARLYMNSNRADKAEKLLTDIIDYQRAFGPAYRLLGNVYSLKGDEKLSKTYLVRANDLTVNPTPVDTLIDRLSLKSRSADYLLRKIDEAENNIFPEYAMDLVTHSLVYFPANNYLVAKAIKLFLVRDMGKKALPYLNQHISYFSNDFKELKNVGDLLYSKAFYPEAMRYYSLALKLSPDDSQVQSCAIICISKEGKKDQALSMLSEVLEKNKSNPGVIADGITLLLNLGEKEKAVKWLSRLKSLSPSFPRGRQISGILAEKDGRWNDALLNYRSAFSEDPDDMTTIRLLGNLLLRQKLWAGALEHFQKALEIHPNEPYILERLGTLYVTCTDAKLRDIAKGKYLCERAFINTSSQSVTMISAGRSLAIAYEVSGDNQNAMKIIKMTINSASAENAPQVYMDDLRALLQQFKKMN